MSSSTLTTPPGKRRAKSPSIRNPRAAKAFFAASLALVVFACGMQFQRKQPFPHELLRSAKKTAESIYDRFRSNVAGYRRALPELSPGEVESARIASYGSDGLVDRIVFPGGAARFAELCPGHPGCIAVEYVGQGQVARVYPYRPRRIEQATIVDLPYEYVLDLGLTDDAYVFAVDTYPNGDLLVVFHYHFAFPYAGGVARIRPDGTPAWYRRDYSHHEPHVADDDVAWVPGLRIGEGPLRVRYEAPKQRTDFQLPCAKPYIDVIRKIGPDGELLEEVSIFEKLAASRHRFLLRDTEDPCDPIHLNSVHELSLDATGPSGIGPGDLVASLRNLHAFVVLDRDDFDIKALVRGTFNGQHSVKHLTGSRFLVFDNLGVEADRDGPSRVLTIDLADGSETTVFPGPQTSEAAQRVFTRVEGQVSISPDRRRVIANFAKFSKAYEIEIATGKVLTEFTSVHDLTPLGEIAGDAQVALFSATPGPRYVLDP